ncbi:MAG: hypothetical protein U0325_25940 [Polyangiales bacterium]
MRYTTTRRIGSVVSVNTAGPRAQPCAVTSTASAADNPMIF